MYDYPSGSEAGLGLIPILFLICLYAYFSFCMMKMAQKTDQQERAWWSWVPILNTFLLARMAAKPDWWVLLCLVPVINLVVFAILWMEAAKAAHCSPVWGFLVLIPFINFVALGVLAFSSPPYRPSPPPYEPQPRQPSNVG